METNLFKPKTLEKLCSDTLPSASQKKAAKKWIELLENNKLEDEKKNYFRFADTILNNLLDYNTKNFDFERHNIEFLFNDSNSKKLVCFEAKGAKTKDLWAYQGRDTKTRATPVNQIWDYLSKYEIPYGILTNYRHFVLFDRGKSYDKYHIFDFLDIKNSDSKLKEFIAVFGKKSIESGFVQKAENESIKEEKNFTKEFYKLFHETRLMLIKEFAENEELHDKVNTPIHFAQIFLNRLMFIFFAEDTDKLPKRIFEDRVVNIVESTPISEHSHYICDSITDLFLSLDKGASTPIKIFGFNGEFFRMPIPRKIYFKDMRDKGFFSEIYQNSSLAKDANLDEITQKSIDKYSGKINPIVKNILLMASFDFKTEVSVNILGHIFEQSLSDIDALKESKISKRKKEGIFYTPEYITDYICRNTIIPYLSKKSAKTPKELVLEYSGNMRELEEKFANIKILDPACGSGAFLIKAVDVLLEIHREIGLFKQDSGQYTSFSKGKNQLMLKKWSEEEEAKEIIQNNIFGVDLNEESVEITKLSLFLKIARKNKKLISLSENIKCGNSLIDDEAVAGKKAFKWGDEFKEIFEKGGFDVVVGNPPYIFAREKISEEEKNYYSSNYDSAQYQVNTYVLFIEKSIALLKNSGNYGLIVPNAWLMVNSAKKLREYILKTSEIKEIINLSGYSFEGVNVETIIFNAKKQNTKTNKINILMSRGKLFEFSHSKNQEDFKNDDDFEFKVFFDDNSKKLLNKLKANSSILNDLTTIKAGLQAYEDGKGNPKQTAEDVKKRPYDFNYKYDKDTHKYLDGKDVGRYYLNWRDLYLKYGEHLAAPRTFNIFSGSKLIIREITGTFPKSIISTFSDELYLFNRSNIAIIEKEGTNISLKYILVILNSSLMSYYFLKSTAKSVRKMFPKIILNDLRKFPIKKIDIEKQTLFIEKADIMLDLNKDFYNKKNKFLSRLKQNLNLTKITKKLDKFYNLDFVIIANYM